ALTAPGSPNGVSGAERSAARPASPDPKAPASEAPPDLQQILAGAQRVQESDVAAWSRYRFSRRAEREDLDDTGGVDGREGVGCDRLGCGPGETRVPGSGLAWKVASVMQGTLWITVAGYHLAWAEAETTRRVPIALSLAKVREVRVSMESGPVGDGVWLPRR